MRFIGIPTLVIADIDSATSDRKKCSVANGEITTNAVIGYWLPDKRKLDDLLKAHDKEKTIGVVRIAYQTPENDRCGRSFEEAFVYANLKWIPDNTDKFMGTKSQIKQAVATGLAEAAYDLGMNINKVDFALDLMTADGWRAPAYINISYNAELPNDNGRKKDILELETAFTEIDKIVYSDRGSNFLEGRIYHDDLIGVAAIMFRTHPLLPMLVGAKYPFILVDEYQDTFPEVVEILLDRIRVRAPHVIVGFFGDKAQAIYDNVVGELSEAHRGTLERIPKEENYRCAIAVIDLLNRFRTDIQQVPAGKNVQGAATYVGFATEGYGSAEKGYEIASGHLVDPPPFNNTKVLYLTHRLIARKAGYGELYDAYRDYGGHTLDQFQSGQDPIMKFLASEVDCLAGAWAERDVGTALTILSKNGFTLQSFAQKRAVSTALDDLVTLVAERRTVGEIVAHVAEKNLLRLIDPLADGIALASQAEANIEEDQKRRLTMFRSLIKVEATQIRLYRRVLEENMPYSTKHGVKGDEFDTVVVVLDDKGARWTKYDFGKLLDGRDNSQARRERTANLFYVCCSRARKNLVVVDLGYTPGRKTGVDALFGPDNVIIA